MTAETHGARLPVRARTLTLNVIIIIFSVEECFDQPTLIIIKQHKNGATHGNDVLEMIYIHTHRFDLLFQ